MRVHYINVEQLEKGEKAVRSSIGGRPIMPAGVGWPQCRLCKNDMIFFFQFDLGRNFDLPLQPGSHALVFMCPVHNDVPTQLTEANNEQLPPQYWNKTFGHYALRLYKPAKRETSLSADKYIASRALSFLQSEEEIDWDGRMERGTRGFKIGGVPNWMGHAEYTRCSCGAEMIFLCQLPAKFAFPMHKTAPVQPDTVAPEGYQLFLGKPTYIFVCKEHCTSESLYAVTQDSLDGLAETA